MNKYGYDLTDADTIEEILYVWEVLEGETIYSQTRWSLYKSKVVKSPLGVPYKISWEEGATEMQDTEVELKMVRVKPEEKKTVVYVVCEED